MSDSFIVFGQPALAEEDIDEVVDTLRSLWIGTGPKARRLEVGIADYTGMQHSIAVNSATAALHLALIASGVGPGDEVIVPSMTFGASVNVIEHVGATPVFVDCDPLTRNVTVDTVAPAVSSRTKAIIPVHMAGYPVDLFGVRDVVGSEVAIIGDAAHALESRIGEHHVAQLADMTAFSFYATKNLTTAEGGMLVLHDEAAADRCRVLSLHGLSSDAWHRYSGRTAGSYEVVEPGFKYNLSDLQAALGVHQLERIEHSLARRREVWERYDAEFADLPLELPIRPPEGEATSGLHLYSPLLRSSTLNRDTFRELLRDAGIGTGIHFVGVHRHPYYRERYSDVELAVTDDVSVSTLSLPLSAGLTDDQVDRVVAAVRTILA